ncbi:UDP-galactose transporter [Calocera cornea HHB12733]|uniref:UDP-galactose transporter homolog 1 n=1 Tax=Calocera cornea HHB12733 TaxID=1353952 RepID=A0A165F7Y1_9BASI|nr:UDP-galactose transporter [Calocera cornea HHB12733]
MQPGLPPISLPLHLCPALPLLASCCRSVSSAARSASDLRMGVIRLGVCVAGVYSMFLLWAVAQERLSVPFQSITDTSRSDKFESSLFINTCQSAASAISALLYLLLRSSHGDTLAQTLGLSTPLRHESRPRQPANGTSNGHAAQGQPANGLPADGAPTNGHHVKKHIEHASTIRPSAKAVLLRYLQCSVLITIAAPFGFASLAHISYPTMVLAKSCKLVPVMIMNVVLYRRKFALHKYVVVATVTAGIAMFMGFGKSRVGKVTSQSSIYGLTLLLINLIIDGATNSTQDEIFSRYRVNGQQMMFFLNLFSTVLTSGLLVLPLPFIPVIHPSHSATPELFSAVDFIRTHPSIIVPLVQYALTGALGQLFIFETLQHFGSLTLVTITLTRKMFTMVLSVFVYNHRLTAGQWAGAGVVFAGIVLEAWVKRKDVHAKRVLQEKEKARLKSL